MNLLSVLVVHAANFEVKTGIPGPLEVERYGILGYIQNTYLLALGAAAALAIGSIVYGAVQYTVSRGNPSKLADAWDRIVQALIGILLLVGAGTLLSIVNPGLLSLELPRLAPVTDTTFDADVFTGELADDKPIQTSTTYPPGTYNPEKRHNGVVPTGTRGCIASPASCTSPRAAGFRCGGSGCGTAMSNMVTCTRTAAESLGVSPGSITFTAAYPGNLGSHCSKMHYNGCAADIVLPSSYARTCSDAVRFVTALGSCGIYALNEYRHGAFANCGTQGSSASTGNHIHIEGCPRGTWDGISAARAEEIARACRR